MVVVLVTALLLLTIEYATALSSSTRLTMGQEEEASFSGPASALTMTKPDTTIDSSRRIEIEVSTAANEVIWETVIPASGQPTKRHEACFVSVLGIGYLIGGRGNRPVDVYDPNKKTWTSGSRPPIELHHMQCVGDDSRGKIWIVSAWTGGYPTENNVDLIHVYDVASDTWATRKGLPERRRRGGGAAVLYGNDIFVSHGNRGGHGSHATTLGWLDRYSITEDKWYTDLPTAPNPRDHTAGAIVDGVGDKHLCVAGGRDGGQNGFFNTVVNPTDCYNLRTGKWSIMAELPQGRAGVAVGRTCDGRLMVAGGEGFGRAFDDVDVFDYGTNTWTPYPSLQEGRHGTGLVFSCQCNQVHIASGSGGQGGGPELTTTETLHRAAAPSECNGWTASPSISPRPSASASVAPSLSPSTSPRPSISVPPIHLYVNAGADEAKMLGGVQWQADTAYAKGGNLYESEQSIDTTKSRADEMIYQTERFGDMTYTFTDLDHGEYLLRLHFAEIYSELDYPGGRIFDVVVQDKVVFDGVDIYASSGGLYMAWVLEVVVSVSGASLKVDFLPRVENPKVSGIELHSQ